uniref:Uncharacterized protein n=1 Tax=Anguilla anguilla TaxID=7936 RepID=A0A0E9RBL3_ANGAN
MTANLMAILSPTATGVTEKWCSINKPVHSKLKRTKNNIQMHR